MVETTTPSTDRYRLLCRTLRDRARKMIDADEENTTEIRDNAMLITTLASVVEGKSVYRAFGAPGDWGYGTEIGEALRACYNQPEGGK